MSAHPYGPNTADIRRLLVQLAGLGTQDRAHVVHAYQTIASTPAWQRAEARLGVVIERSGRETARDALTGPLLQLVKRPDAPEPSGPSPDRSSDEEALAMLDPIAEPALAALLALLVKDLLTPQDVTLLLSPFEAAGLTFTT